jgi:hypothetical protein
VDKATTDEIAAVREEQRARQSRGAYFWLIMVAYMVAAPALAILVSRQISITTAQRTTHSSEQKLCAVVILSDDFYRKLAPTSTNPTVKAQAKAMSDLRAQFHCPPPKE